MKGKIYKLYPPEQKTEKFSKQEFILQVTNPTQRATYVDFIKFQCINDRISLLNDAGKGDIVVCKFNIRGKKIGKGEDEIFFNNNDVIDLAIINKTEDIIKADVSHSYKDTLPGLDDLDEDIDDIPQQDIAADLPF